MRRLIAGFALVASTTLVSAETYWVPAAAHVPGVGTSRWRTDVAVLNLCPAEAVVEFRLHTEDGVFAETFVIAGGELQVFQDVVANLTTGNAAGALEVRSDVGLTVTSRTYNLDDEGTFGQSLDAVTASDGREQGAVVYLQQLAENGAFRTNISALNMGGAAAAITVDLFDRNGADVGSFRLDVPPGRFAQDDRPYRRRFGRSDIVGGYARVTVEIGSGVYPYGVVIDNATGDPTGIVARPASECPADIAQQLAAIPGMTVSELATEHEGYRYFELHFVQPADHDQPNGPTFSQYMTLLHRSYDAPMILRTLGYRNTSRDRKAELTGLLGSNQLVVEHRYFADSTPAEGWGYLNIRQAAADHHRIVEAIRPLYPGRWLNTGHSKGGMTAIFHRRFYPEDVDATVAYVAPLSYGPNDERYLDFLADVGTAECNEDVWAVQREALNRRVDMLELMEDFAGDNGYTYDLIGGFGPAFESVVMEVPFTFWQYAGETFCAVIPGTGATDAAIFQFLSDFVGWWTVADVFFDIYGAYFFQAHSEFGYPAVATDHIRDLMLHDPPSVEEGVPPPGSNPVFDPAVMPAIAGWVAGEGERLMFIYGENDPWTAGAFELGEAEDSFTFVDPGGTHGARITSLDPEDRNAAFAIIHRWTGVEPVMPASAKTAPDRFPPWRPTLPPARTSHRVSQRGR